MSGTGKSQSSLHTKVRNTESASVKHVHRASVPGASKAEKRLYPEDISSSSRSRVQSRRVQINDDQQGARYVASHELSPQKVYQKVYQKV